MTVISDVLAPVRSGRAGRCLAACAAGFALVLGLGVPALPAAAQEASSGGSGIEYALPSKLAAKTLLLDVAHAGERLVAVGAYGHIVYSDDDGKTWTQAESVPTQVTLTSVYFPSAKVGFAGGHDTTLLKTEDGGQTWTRMYEDMEAETPIMTVLFENERRGLAMGAFSFVMETTDGGVTWEPRQLIEGSEDDYHLNKAFRGKDGTIFVAAEFGTVYRSTDNGRTFESLQTPYSGSFWSGLGVDDGSVLLYGMRGNIYRTTDNGDSWTKVEAGTSKSFGGSTQLANGTIVLAGLNGAVAYSTDRGKSFTTVTRADRLGFNAVTDGADGTIVIFGEPGAKIMPDNAAAAAAASS